MHEVTRQFAEELGVGENVSVINNNIIFQRDKPPEKLGSIFLPEERIQRPNWGTVATAPEEIRLASGRVVKTNLVPGDRIFVIPSDSQPFSQSKAGRSKFDRTSIQSVQAKEVNGEIVAMENYTIVQVDCSEKISPGGIILVKQEVIKEDPGEGVVINSGVPDVKEGDKVMYEKGMSNWVDMDNGKLAVHSRDLMGVLTDE